MQSQARNIVPTVRRVRVMRRGVIRSRNGCNTCRRRKKKCDETPGESCFNCKKGNINCSGYPQRVEWSPENPLRRSSARRSQAVVAQENSVSPLASINPPQENYNFDFYGDSNPMSLQDFQQSFGSEMIIGGSNSQINIDLQADPLFQTNFSYVQDLALFQEIQQRSPLYDIRLPHLINGVDTPLQKQLFDQYRFSTSTFLTTKSGPDNPFNSIVLPLAVQDKTLMRLLLSLAGSQLLKRIPPGSNPELRKETIRLHQESQQEQYQRVQILKTQIEDHPTKSVHDDALISTQAPTYTDRDLEVIFTTYLVLCLYEIFEGSRNGSGNAHLASAGRFINLATKSSPDIDGSLLLYSGRRLQIDPFLLDFYKYHMFLASVTAPSTPLIHLQNDELVEVSCLDQHLVGVQDGLFKFIARILSLRADADKIGGDLDLPLINTALAISADLEAWKPQITSSRPESLVAGFYQMALYIWLFSIMHPYRVGHRNVQTNVRRIVEGMCDIGPGDGVMACMLFPLFVAGAAALSQKDRGRVAEHFAKLNEWSAFGNIDSSFNSVKEMWKLHDAGEKNSWNWVKQLNSTQMSILVT